MNYTIKTHAPLIEKMYEELGILLPHEEMNSDELGDFRYKLRSLYRYVTTVYELARTEEK